jgi:hypothetical protein
LTLGLVGDLLSNACLFGIYSFAYFILYFCVMRWRYLLPLDQPLSYLLWFGLCCAILHGVTLIITWILVPSTAIYWFHEGTALVLECILTICLSLLLSTLPQRSLCHFMRAYYYRR